MAVEFDAVDKVEELYNEVLAIRWLSGTILIGPLKPAFLFQLKNVSLEFEEGERKKLGEVGGEFINEEN